jgi:hypothetical protein
MTFLKLEFVIVKVSGGDRPSGYLRCTITERGKELGETVPVDRGVVMWEIIIDSYPVMFTFDESEKRSR